MDQREQEINNLLNILRIIATTKTVIRNISAPINIDVMMRGDGSVLMDTGPHYDVFDYGDHYVVVIEANDASLDTLSIYRIGDRVRILINGATIGHIVDVNLPNAASLIDKKLHNGVLTLVFSKTS